MAILSGSPWLVLVPAHLSQPGLQLCPGGLCSLQLPRSSLKLICEGSPLHVGDCPILVGLPEVLIRTGCVLLCLGQRLAQALNLSSICERACECVKSICKCFLQVQLLHERLNVASEPANPAQCILNCHHCQACTEV